MNIRKTQDPKFPYAQTPRQQFVGGLVEIASGLLRVISLGRLAAPWNLAYAIRCARKNQP